MIQVLAGRIEKLDQQNRMLKRIGILTHDGLDLRTLSASVGRPLSIDPKTERFSGDDDANKLLRRECRKPFVVPDEV